MTENRASLPPESSISTGKLFSYFFPELITATLLYVGLEIIDYRFLACTNVASCNATLIVTNQLFHCITKIAEGFSVGMVIICGQYNGAHEYHKTGKVVSDAFWTTALIGALTALFLYLGAHAIFAFYEAPAEIVALGVPFLKIRSLGVFFSFIYFALLGFLRGIKQPKMAMILFLVGAVFFLFFDYAFIFGVWGFPRLGLIGSAIATVIQYGIMLSGALAYVFLHPGLRKYRINLLAKVHWPNIRDLVHVSWPVMIDKASFALCPIWLNKMLGCTAKLTTALTARMMFDSYSILKIIERVAILPGVAFAQVTTYLVSNDYKIHHFTVIKRNIKKVLLLATLIVASLTLFMVLNPHLLLALLHKQRAFNDFLATALPYIVILIIFDVLQLILSAALRGAADVQAVMWSRMVVAGLFFVPLAYVITHASFDNLMIKFVLLYGSVHMGYALMSLIYLVRFKTGAWKRQSIRAEINKS